MRGLKLNCAALALVSTWVVPAFAQSADPSAEAKSDDIVVTARRQEESLQKVPVAVTALSQDVLREQSIYSSGDLAKAVPGLATGTQAGSGSFVTFSIRGRGTNYGAAAGSVESYFADIPLSAPQDLFYFQPQFFDLQSVQVLKGPQGTLFGRSTTGGAILFVPKAPTDKFEGYARVQGGGYNNVQLEGAVNLPMGDKAALRLAGFWWRRDGYSHTFAGVKNVLTGQTMPSQEFNNRNQLMLRGTLLLKPADGITNSTIVSYERLHEKSSPEAGLLLLPSGVGTANPTFTTIRAPGEGTRFSYLDADLNRPPLTAFLVANTTTFELSDTFSIKNILGFIATKGSINTNQDDDGTPNSSISLMPLGKPWKSRQYTEELQLLGKARDGAIQYTLGGMVDLTRQPGGSNIGQSLATLTGPGACPSVGGVSCNLVSVIFNQNRISSLSLYASGTWKVTDQLTLSGGFRHLWDSVSLVNNNTTTGVLAVPGALPTETPNPANYLFYKSKFQGNVWNIGANYDVTDKVMVYGGWRRGFKRGGFNLGAPSPQTQSFGPEKVDDLYVGLKSDFHIGNMPVRFNIEGYYDFYKGNQVSYLDLNLSNFQIATVTTNVDKTVYRGFEFDLAAEPANWLKLTGSFSFTDGKNTKWVDQTVPGSTVDLARNPVGNYSKIRTQVTARFHGELPDGKGELVLAPTISYQSKLFGYPFSSVQPLSFQRLLSFPFFYGDGVHPVDINGTAIGANVVPAVTQIDLRAEWNRVLGSRWDLAANVTNLTNKDYINGISFAIYFGFQGQSHAAPRMWSIDLSTKF